MAAWRLLERRPANEAVFARFDTPGHRWPEGPDGAGRDPYLDAGSHPDCVSRVWDVLGAALPEDCRFLVLGRPVLAHPASGFVFALPMGTQYAIWVPRPQHADAVAARLSPAMRWSGGSVTNVEAELGEGWLFGAFRDGETRWVTAAYEAAGA